MVKIKKLFLALMIALLLFFVDASIYAQSSPELEPQTSKTQNWFRAYKDKTGICATDYTTEPQARWSQASDFQYKYLYIHNTSEANSMTYKIIIYANSETTRGGCLLDYCNKNLDAVAGGSYDLIPLPEGIAKIEIYVKDKTGNTGHCAYNIQANGHFWRGLH